MKCPCCGSAVDRQDRPLISLDSNTMSAGAHTIRLSAREAELMTVLAEMMPVPVHMERIAARVYGGSPIDDPYDNIKVYIHRLRKKVHLLGLSITTVWGKGHALIWQRAA